ncbi:hypothetical protein PIB30_055551 [Stylosanthes scabra]|uniref:ATP-dependent DNA helicase RecQ zinc-binding domain-containing protein n=1 Tax=Stylosanthes scabra TaxID=79078 RepID=A0ABU6WHF5_9FABA|nr:hypothetical protein [Stylosanthes scabra]
MNTTYYSTETVTYSIETVYLNTEIKIEEDKGRMEEFILRNSGNKKNQSSTSQEESSRKSLADFTQMVEYCEGSGCRRKRILESFGEKVTASVCEKTCDACRHPNLVARNLEDLTTAIALRQKGGGSSRIFITSSSDAISGEQLSEFWNRGDEAIGSDDDISDSDDGNEVVNNLTKSKLHSGMGVNEKLAMLQRAEENFYQNAKKQSKVEKHAISDAMRESSRQRLQNALKQAQQRLDDLKIELESSASFLEDECFKKYSKAGKSFYYSQVASTVRWLATASSVDLMDRLGAMKESTSTNALPESELHTPPDAVDHSGKEGTSNEGLGNAQLETSPCGDRGMPIESSSINTKLPQIPSFNEFVNSRKTKGDQLNDTKKYSSRVEKKMRVQ